ncbi:uncharacterized protein si:dkey-13m1.5 isoform X1 [Micropterus dolomieu]|uniref:uncharacterized protein si:dkey-13m1.5 isoform X1 n=1 Tax=Micropterus dolomieu TaxID=147949 RepID=UPI001E8DC738|nr:uncharacterized protein si:dkey-13m1.5 isoform X1 [Micropterus dolomieu]
MTSVVKTLIQTRPVGKEFFLTTNIPFLERHNPDAFSTSFQEDFQPLSLSKTEPAHQPHQAQVDHKDLRHIKEFLTEVMVSYQRHPLPQMTRTPRWTKLHTNLKMQTDPGEVTFLTTQSQAFQPQPFQHRPTPIRQTLGIKKIQQVGKIPESVNKVSFTPHHGSPVVKAMAKHLEEGFPTIKGDIHLRGFVSHYNNTFQGAWSRAAQSVEKHTSSVAMGDPVKIVERETTHTASFSRPTVYRPSVIKEHLKLNLGNFSNDSWSCTSRQGFCFHKPGDPVVLIKRNQNSSSLPKGDTDTRRNKERMSVTTNRISFSDLNHTELPVYVPGPDLMTKSHVQFSPPHLSGPSYTTTTKEHYIKQDREPAKPVIQLPSNILSGPEHGLSLSTTKSDYLPLKACRHTPCQSQQRTNIKFPLAYQHFTTTHSETYTAKPLVLQRPSCSQFLSHFVMK